MGICHEGNSKGQVVTVRLYHYIIGNAWGLPQGMEGPEHHWRYLTGEHRGKWKSTCGKHVIEANHEFGGVPSIKLTFEHNPLKQNRCDECIAIYMGTHYGKKLGIHPPYRDALNDALEYASKDDPRR